MQVYGSGAALLHKASQPKLMMTRRQAKRITNAVCMYISLHDVELFVSASQTYTRECTSFKHKCADLHLSTTLRAQEVAK